MGKRKRAKRSKADAQAKAMRGRVRRMRRQQNSTSKLALYGASRQPGLVTVKRLDGTVVEVVQQAHILEKPKPARKHRGESKYSHQLEVAAKVAGFDSYAVYLRSSHWLSVRAQVLSRDKNRCRKCGRSSQLTVHHDRYTTLGAENLEFLKTMCWPCHRKIHTRHQ